MALPVSCTGCFLNQQLLFLLYVLKVGIESLSRCTRVLSLLMQYDVTCMNELPSSYDAYRKQQHRWSAGPMQLFRKALPQIVQAQAVPAAVRFYIAVFFFGVRMLLSHFVSIILYVLLIPTSIIVPELKVPLWSIVYVPLIVTLSTTLLTPGGLQHAITYVLFENSISLLKLQAVISGLLNLQGSHTWTVTQKLGSWVKKQKQRSKALQTMTTSIAPAATVRMKVYWRELAVFVFMVGVAVVGIVDAISVEALAFVLLQALAFLAFALGMVDSNWQLPSWSSSSKQSTECSQQNGDGHKAGAAAM